MMGLDIRGEHYSTQDRLLLIAAGDALIAWARDIAMHEGDGHRWDRSPNDDAVLMAAELGWLLSATTTTLQQALQWYRRATDNARDRAADELQR
ncbi:MAG: hypothetical protein KY460_10490 [Actinobacteria bacterium]|nr:hypothetical protein [Actinomycetota bacterium]